MAVVKVEEGFEFPAEAYLYVPDPDKPSTWKLRIWETPDDKITRAQLGRAAAALGPGFRGQRVDLPQEDRRTCARKLIGLYRKLDVPDEEIPDYLWRIAGMTASDDDIIEREAILCVAGEYPDKGITLTEVDLDVLASSAAQREVPIRIEHISTPLDGYLGKVKRAWREGKYLKAILEFTRPAWELLARAGARELSIGITQDKKLREVSVVRNPRVAEARVFSADEFELISTNNITLTEEAGLMTANDAMNEVEALKQRVKELEFSLRVERINRELDGYIAQGKLLPAHRDIVSALMALDGDIQFSGQSVTPYELVKQFIDSLPPLIELGANSGVKETVQFGSEELSPEEKQVVEKLGLSSEQYLKYKGG